MNNSNVVFPDSGQVNYYTSDQPFLNFRCAYSGCHSDFHLAGGRSMASYFRLFESANLGLVIPNNSTSSVLFQIINGQNNHLYIYNLPLPTESQINGMKRWIDQGAGEF